ncbi:hypothetical protein [Vannielia litorea]|uniref:hypothetical protein n=1 Tax=Vannielia litorea TaxID=1217970 RepID=UPI001BD01CBC|nr:hypothetical protein [Vannielia litorea]
MTMDMAVRAKLNPEVAQIEGALLLPTQSVQLGLAGEAELEMKRAESLLAASARLQGKM